MRFYEISSGLRVPVDAEQQALLDLAIEQKALRAAALDERDAEVASQMASRGLLLVSKDEDGIAYAPNHAHDLWRM